MRPGLFLVSKRLGLYAANRRTKEALEEFKLEPGQLVSVAVIRSRNPKLCALAHSVIARVADAMGVTSFELTARLKERLGYCDLVQMPDGSMKRIARRASFEDLPDEDAFREFWRALEIEVCSELLPELPNEEQGAILRIMNGGK